jgi:predicted transcriptional regulator
MPPRGAGTTPTYREYVARLRAKREAQAAIEAVTGIPALYEMGERAGKTKGDYAFSFTLSPGQRARLDRVADEVGVSCAALMRQALEIMLDYYETQRVGKPAINYEIAEEQLDHLRKRLGKWGMSL